jgi:cytochrome c-type biogenesis protein CcmH/NrfG/shikimate kinase
MTACRRVESDSRRRCQIFLFGYSASMKRLALMFFLLSAALSPLHAQQDADDRYLAIYSRIEQADRMSSSEQAAVMLPQYVKAQDDLQTFQKIYPDWNPKIISFRLDYVAQKIADLTPLVVVKNAIPTNTPSSTEEWKSQFSVLHQQVQALQAENATLQAKLQEALAEQPATIDSRELDRAQDQINSLMKENDLLKASMAELAPSTNLLRQAVQALSEANKKLTDERARADQLAYNNQILQGRLQMLASRPGSLDALRGENSLLKKQLADLKAVTNSVSGGFSAEMAKTKAQIAVLQSDAEVALLEKAALENKMRNLQTTNRAAVDQAENEARIRALTDERNNLLAKLGEADKELYGGRHQSAAAQVSTLSDEVQALRARLAVDEAQVIPYTPDEMALFKQNEPVLGSTNAEKRSFRQLPAGSAALVTEAQHYFSNKEYDKAADDYGKILKLDENNPLVLANLATIEMEEGKLDDAGKHLQAALAKNPDDAYNLSALGYLKLRQEKYDEALDALGRAARLDPQNAEIQNYLGVTLGHKGLRAQAETALRKAVQLNPNFAPAHNNLAVIYISQQPPLAELARWHYLKALDAGQPRNPDLEKLLAAKGAPVNSQ